MTLFRTTALIATSIAALGFTGVASAQISIGDEYRTAYDVPRDSFGEDYGSQKLAAEEARANGRTMSKTVSRVVSAAMKAGQAGNYEDMVSETAKGLKNSKLTPYEKSVLYQLNAAGSLKAQNFSGAKQSYEAALATGGMNDDEQTKVNATLAKLNAAGIQ